MTQALYSEAANQSPVFLECLELPPVNSCRLGVTATRALERYSNLLDHQQARANLRQTEIIDITDEFLDLVVVNPETPAGFELTGLSLAEFLAALYRAEEPPNQLAKDYRQVLTHTTFDDLREGARERIRILRKDCWFRRLALRLPAQYRNAHRLPFPEGLAGLISAAAPDWEPPPRSAQSVEILHTAAAFQTCRIPLHGKRFPRHVEGHSWVNWWNCRLLPRVGQDIMGLHASDDYNEVQLALPCLDTSYFSPHYPVRNLFAHFRYTLWRSTTGARVMLIDEVQSDWLRNWRWQRLGRGLPDTRVVGGSKTQIRDLPPIPPCPFQDSWLEVAAEMIFNQAKSMNCQAVAWITGRIQHALNPTLPLPTAERLYDQRFPNALKQILLAEGCRVLPFPIDYPCWSTDYYTRWTRGHGWRVYKRDGDQPSSDFFKTWEEANQPFATLAQPVVERLPGYLLS